MKPWLDQSWLRPDSTREETREDLRCMAADLGVDHVAFYLLHPVVGFSSVSTFPPKWVRWYRESGYHRIDPVIRMARRTVRPFLWSRDRFPCELPVREWAYLEEAGRHGFRYGLAIPVHGPGGFPESSGSRSSIGILNLVDADAGRLGRATRMEPARLFAVAFDLRDCLLGNEHPGEAGTGEAAGAGKTVAGEAERILTKLERECLALALEGHTAAEAAALLGLSASSVHRYSSNAQRKLGCANKYQAAVRAMRLGLLGDRAPGCLP